MQTLIKVSNRMKWYFVKLTSPLKSFKNWLLTDLMIETERLDHRVDSLESNVSLEDLDNRVEGLEYYDLDDIQEKAENAERKAEDAENKLGELSDNIIDTSKRIAIIEGNIKTIKNVDFGGIADRLNELDERVEDNKLKIVQSQIDLQCVNNNIEYLKNGKKQPALKASLLEKERQLKKERSEASLSAMQKLSFEICKYYGGDFNLDDFNNCYEIINKYDVKEGK